MYSRILLSFVFVLSALSGCDKKADMQGGGSVGRPIFHDDSHPTTPPPKPETKPEPSAQPQGGLMTAGAFDDNLNFSSYDSFVAPYRQAHPELVDLVPVAARQAGT